MAAAPTAEQVAHGVLLEEWIERAPATASYGRLPPNLAAFVQCTPLNKLRLIVGPAHQNRVCRLKHRANNKSSQDSRRKADAGEVHALRTQLNTAVEDLASLTAHCALLESYVAAFEERRRHEEEEEARHDLFGPAWMAACLAEAFLSPEPSCKLKRKHRGTGNAATAGVVAAIATTAKRRRRETAGKNNGQIR